MSFVGQLGKAVAGANAAQSGQTAAPSEPDVTSTGSVDSDTDSSDYTVRASDSLVGDENLPADSEDTSTASSDAQKAPLAGQPNEQAKQKTSEREVITVTDETGKRRRIEIDYSDKAKVKKAYELAAGARKWQAERDQVLAREKDLSGKMSSYDLLEKAWAERGEEGVVDLLAGRKGHYQDQVRKQMDRAKFLERASPEEIEALKERENTEHRLRDLEKLRKENEDFKKQVSEQREVAEMRSLESKVHPAFHKNRFAGRLGNESQEHMLDEMLWNTTLKRLEPYEEQGLDISPELLEKEFATAARNIRQLIGKQAEKKASRAVEQKKQEATENVQAAVMSGYTTGGAAKEARDLVQSGNTRGLLKNWGKYGQYFGGKK